ncbi:ribosomal protection-like ABC-F family protein [Acidaminobacter hydrogenoformans]|uniref:ATP-binding cassette, subfamily F, member 3 n=1 Tax=Acidaminobacter hydrogenoformans DSM 2784 TaxID=1120920 RepID=A0A1G5S335_9FIRM|nr:ABC-F family ATP-binding cassette domain-containing protein [Acidaminobacter hydrogenoformans]SCZ80537.1 ATP-binding cassette, subfamily F, member 3 [Acidaminobacter hydrogenoformans DSM 2784]
MIALSCNNLTKYYGVDRIFEDISFTMSQGDRVGLIGRNGAGKTTLFKILTGQISSDSGTLYRAKESEFGYLEQIVPSTEPQTLLDFSMSIFSEMLNREAELRALEHEIAGADPAAEEENDKRLADYAHKLEAFEKDGGYTFRSEVKGVLRGLGFEESEFGRDLNELSGGQKSRLSIGRLLLKKPALLLLDEPTNHLDIDACAWLESYLKSYPGTMMIISHDRYFLDQLVNKIYEIENGKLTEYNGLYSDYAREKRLRFDAEIKAYEKQQREIERQEDMIRRFKQHGTEKLAKRARSREKQLDKVERIDRPVEDHRRTKLRLTQRIQSGEDVLAAEHLSKSYGGREIFKEAELFVYRGDRVGLIGANGVGKTTLFNILCGKVQPDDGYYKLGHKVEIGLYDQEQSNLNPEHTLLEEISDADPKLDLTAIRTLLGAFLFFGDDVQKVVSQLSGGERGRLSLLKLMLSEANLLLLDEPTNHLDIQSKEALESALENYAGTIITISHDRYFLNRLCNRLIELKPDGTTLYLGNYDDYKEKLSTNQKLENDPEQTVVNKTKQKEERRREKERLSEERARKRDLQSLETRLHLLENELHEIEQKMCDVSISQDHQALLSLTETSEALKSEIEALYERWSEHLEE